MICPVLCLWINDFLAKIGSVFHTVLSNVLIYKNVADDYYKKVARC